MKTKKPKKKEESGSSSSSSSSESSDSSSNSSESSGSPSPKKSKKLIKKKRANKSDSSSEGEKVSTKKVADNNKPTKQKDAAHSKWDSPVEKTDKKKKHERDESGTRDRKEKSDRKDRDSRSDRERDVSRDQREDNRDYRRNERNDDRGQRHDNDRDRRRNDNQTRNRDNKRPRYDDQRNDDRRNRRFNSRDRSPQRDRKDKPDFDSQRNNNRRRRSNSFDHNKATWGRGDQGGGKDKKDKQNSNKEKEKPNFGLSGKLTEETNTFKGVVIKYSEPPEARKPKRRWRLYPFKGEKAMQTLYIHRESAYLIGRDRKVVDLPVDHPSCSKQHAALQYRLVTFTRDDGSTGKRVRPYLIDLESANGTFLNNKKIDPRKYVELLERDVIKFGFSSREYVLLHENSKDEGMDDDVKVEQEESTVKDEPED